MMTTTATPHKEEGDGDGDGAPVIFFKDLEKKMEKHNGHEIHDCVGFDMAITEVSKTEHDTSATVSEEAALASATAATFMVAEAAVNSESDLGTTNEDKKGELDASNGEIGNVDGKNRDSIRTKEAAMFAGASHVTAATAKEKKTDEKEVKMENIVHDKSKLEDKTAIDTNSDIIIVDKNNRVNHHFPMNNADETADDNAIATREEYLDNDTFKFDKEIPTDNSEGVIPVKDVDTTPGNDDKESDEDKPDVSIFTTSEPRTPAGASATTTKTELTESGRPKRRRARTDIFTYGVTARTPKKRKVESVHGLGCLIKYQPGKEGSVDAAPKTDPPEKRVCERPLGKVVQSKEKQDSNRRGKKEQKNTVEEQEEEVKVEPLSPRWAVTNHPLLGARIRRSVPIPLLSRSHTHHNLSEATIVAYRPMDPNGDRSPDLFYVVHDLYDFEEVLTLPEAKAAASLTAKRRTAMQADELNAVMRKHTLWIKARHEAQIEAVQGEIEQMLPEVATAALRELEWERRVSLNDASRPGLSVSHIGGKMREAIGNVQGAFNRRRGRRGTNTAVFDAKNAAGVLWVHLEKHDSDSGRMFLEGAKRRMVVSGIQEILAEMMKDGKVALLTGDVDDARGRFVLIGEDKGGVGTVVDLEENIGMRGHVDWPKIIFFREAPVAVTMARQIYSPEAPSKPLTEERRERSMLPIPPSEDAEGRSVWMSNRLAVIFHDSSEAHNGNGHVILPPGIEEEATRRSARSTRKMTTYSEGSSAPVRLIDWIMSVVQEEPEANHTLLDIRNAIGEGMGDMKRYRTLLERLIINGAIRRSLVDFTLKDHDAVVDAFNKDGMSPALQSYCMLLLRMERTLRSLLLSRLQVNPTLLAFYAETSALDDTMELPPGEGIRNWTQDHPLVGTAVRRDTSGKICRYCPSLDFGLEQNDRPHAGHDGRVVLARPAFEVEWEDLSISVLSEGQIVAAADAHAVHIALEGMEQIMSGTGHREQGHQKKVGDTIILGAGPNEKVSDWISVNVVAIGEKRGQLLMIEELEDGNEGVAFWGILRDTWFFYEHDSKPKTKASWTNQSISLDETMFIIDWAIKQPKNVHFLYPVDVEELGLDDYYGIVSHPMDWSTIEGKLYRGEYHLEGNQWEVDVDKFKEDVMLIYDNCMLYNDEGDWIHNEAIVLKARTLKKIDFSFKNLSKKKKAKVLTSNNYDSVSDGDYEEEDQEEFLPDAKTASVPGTLGTFVGESIEISYRLSSLLDLIPMQTDASRFALPVTWSMRSRPKGLAEGPHRSRRGDASKRLGLQYFCPDDPDNKFGRDRVETEAILERSHAEMEVEYRCWISNYHGEDISGSVPFHNGFPPYLGRLCGGFWQIRTPFASSAIRWITRGLLHSGHLSEVEKIATSSPGGGSVMVANAYMKSEHLFDCVQRPVVSRAKKKEVEEEMEEEQEKIELSEYERMRADRVARNKERLKMLGLG